MAMSFTAKVAAALLLLYTYSKYRRIFGLFKWRLTDTTLLQRLGRVALCFPQVAKLYKVEVNKQLGPMRLKTKGKWEEFGERCVKVPEKGLSISELKRIVDRMASVTRSKCETNHMSGSIYSFSLRKAGNTQDGEFTKDKTITDGSCALNVDSPAEVVVMAGKLKEIYSYSFGEAYLWNSLHTSEFGVGDWLSYQVVRMVADLYGGAPDDVMGLVTTGGTGSIMAAMRAYRDWGVANRGHGLGEGVILCLESIHAAVNKAGIAYNIGVEMLPVDEHDRVDLDAVRSAVKRLGNKLICIVGSTPSYPLGVVDPIRELAAIAVDAGVGMHVDSCLGGYIVNFMDHIDTNYLQVPGVSSLSCDTHKNGWAPKGSSVVVTRAVPDQKFGVVNLSYYMSYAIPGWSGGIYGTPADPGSCHVTHTLHAYLAMLALGKDGYRRIAKKINETGNAMAKIIAKHPELKLLGQHPDGTIPANVVSWTFVDDLKKKWGGGAIYAFAHEMEVNHVTVSALKGHRLHFCITGRSAIDPDFLDEFEHAVSASMKATAINAEKVISGEAAFPGDAGLYGTLEAAMSPTSENSKSQGEMIQNMLLGYEGVCDGVKSYFYALQDPYLTAPL